MIIIKPDAFERGVVGFILTSLLARHGRILSGYMKTFSEQDCAIHYRDHVGKPYYRGLCIHMKSDPSLILQIQGEWNLLRAEALHLRDVIGGCEGPRNLIHASDSFEADTRETGYWFP